jgi:hypothetical protein
MKVRLIDHLATDHFGNIEPGCVLDIQPEMAARWSPQERRCLWMRVRMWSQSRRAPL